MQKTDSQGEPPQNPDRYREIFNNSPVMYFTLRDDGIILAVNEFGAQQLEYEPAELIGKSIVDLFHEPDKASGLGVVQTCLATPGHVFHSQLRKRKKKGEIIWTKGTAWAVKDTDGRIVVLEICQDITSQIRSQQALHDSEEKFRTVFEMLPVGVAILDAFGKIVDANPALSKIWRYSHEELLNNQLGDRQYLRSDGSPLPPWEFASSRARAEDRIVSDVETGIVLDENEIVWTRVTAMPTRLGSINMVVATQDITDQHHTTEELRRREQELGDFFDKAPLGCLWVDADGRILKVNETELATLGYSRGEFLGRHLSEFYAEPEVATSLMERFLKREDVRDFETRIKRKDGSVVHVLISSNVFWKDNQFIHSRLFTRDITKQKQAEEELKLVRRAENERIGRELHDGLGGHITGIRYLLDSAIRKVDGTPLSETMHVMRHCSELLQESLVFIRQLARGLETTSMHGDFTTELNSLRDGMEATFMIPCHLTVDPKFHPARDAAVEILQIVRESVTNAVRHGDPGQIWISAHGKAITIENDGRDFPGDENITLGIGLNSMRQRARSIGGQLLVSKRQGGGAVCTIILPDEPNAAPV
ncbi:MAG: PAS domain S-box protein [Spirochaetia bacterium]|nr:PAS domain S-box protein [Spirochaetia bacterium]